MNISKYQFYKDLIKLPFIKEVWLFGSRARGDNQERADLDIAIYCPKASDKNWMAVLDIIDKADTLLEIDCIRLDQLDETSLLKQEIKNKGIKIYDKQ